MSHDARCNSVYNLLRRTPVQQTTKSLSAVMSVAPELADDILPNVDEPLRLISSTKIIKPFLTCDYNRDGDYYRAPGTKQYYTLEGNNAQSDFYPSDNLLHLENDANALFDLYRNAYFTTGTSSVYFFESEDNQFGPAFGAAWLVHKEAPAKDTLQAGWWDSTHIFDVQPTGQADTFKYTITSTVLISMNLKEQSTGDVDLSGSLTIQKEKTVTLSKFKGHINVMGPLLEEQESLLRNRIEQIYIGKTREVIGVRTSTGARDMQFNNIIAELKK
jgi:capping protein beta